MTNATTEATSSKREERWFLLRFVILLVAIVVGFIGLISVRGKIDSSKYPRVQLPDGSWLIARQVSVGRNHSIEVPYQMGVQFRRWQQSYSQSKTASEDRTVVWLMRENERGERLDLNWLKHVEIEAGDARTIRPSQFHRQTIQANSGSGSGTDSSGFSDAKAFGSATVVDIALIHFELPIMRPRDQAMMIRVFDGEEKVIAGLSIPHPKLPDLSTEVWEPDVLPASRTDRNLTVTLKSVEFFESHNQQGVYVRPQLSFTHDGEESHTWGAGEQLVDPLGNHCYAWNCDLSTAEPAWKLQLTLSQRADGHFQPEETRKLPLRTLTIDKQLDVVSETYQVNGATKAIVGYGGKGPISFTLPNSNSSFKTGTYQPTQYSSGMTTSCNNNKCDVEFSSGLPFVITKIGLAKPDLTTQLVFRDQDGQILTQRGTSGTEGLTFWFFEPKPTSTAIEIEIITQQQHHVEFLIAPPRPEQVKKRQ